MNVEEQYAGAIVAQPELYWANQVSPDDITDPFCRSVVSVTAEMLREGVPVDVVSVSERGKFRLDNVVNLARDCYSPIGAVSAAPVIREAAARRRVIWALREALSSIDEGAEPRLAVQGIVESMDAAASEGSVTISEAVESIRNVEKSPAKLFTPLPTLNDLLPLEGGRLVVVAGRPGTFKSAFLLHTARFSAVRKAGVGILSLEMSAGQLARRYIRMGEPEALPIWINSTAHEYARIEEQIIAWVQRDGCRGVGVDYLQLIHFPGAKNMRRDEVVGQITRRLKLLSMRLDIPIILLAQLNRQNEIHNRRPILSDLRESGNIEQDADAVIFLHKYERNEKPEYELILAKHRDGRTGTLDLHIDAEKYRVMEAAK